MTNAVAYVRDFTLGNAGEILTRDRQVELIRYFAEDYRIEIVGWFEDSAEDSPILSRPGIQAMLACRNPYQSLICERFWAISKSMKRLAPFLEELDRRGIHFEAVTPLWDCVSQQCRRYVKSLPIQPSIHSPAMAAHVAKPAHFYFERMVHRIQTLMR
jgi:hypothetical protein